MKQKANARQRRETETLRRKEALHPQKQEPAAAEAEKPTPAARVKQAGEALPAKTPEEEALEFMEYLDRHGVPAEKEDPPCRAGKKGKPGGAEGTLPRLNLEEGMPVISEALKRMNLGIQELRVSRVKAAKLIHGYGSTGRGGGIRTAVRQELAAMKRKKQISGFIAGEDFGPTDEASRRLAEQQRSVTRDPDYGRMNHGITIVVL